jgi:hypothetical protein
MKARKTTSDNRIGIWMNHTNAYFVFRNEEGEYVLENIKSDAHRSRNTSGEDGRVSEIKNHNRDAEALKAFFKTLQKKLTGYNHILITGPTTARAEFLHHLQKVRSFTGKRIAEEKAATMTQRQLLSYMKKKLGKPMNIFREEEVIA